MKTSVRASLGQEDRAILEELKRATGRSESELIGEGLRLIWRDLECRPNALEIAGKSSGRFAGGPKDLSTRKEHLADFGR